jgi:hypothetical protein
MDQRLVRRGHRLRPLGARRARAAPVAAAGWAAPDAHHPRRHHRGRCAIAIHRSNPERQV